MTYFEHVTVLSYHVNVAVVFCFITPIHSLIHSFNDSSIHFHPFTLPSCAIQLRIAGQFIYCPIMLEVHTTQFNRPNQFI